MTTSEKACGLCSLSFPAHMGVCLLAERVEPSWNRGEQTGAMRSGSAAMLKRVASNAMGAAGAVGWTCGALLRRLHYSTVT